MRQIQVGVFILGVISIIAAMFFIGDDTADILWRLGVAVLLIDIVLIKLWQPPGGMK